MRDNGENGEEEAKLMTMEDSDSRQESPLKRSQSKCIIRSLAALTFEVVLLSRPFKIGYVSATNITSEYKIAAPEISTLQIIAAYAGAASQG